VFVVGRISSPEDLSNFYRIAAYDQRSGELIWGEMRGETVGISARAVACGADIVVTVEQPFEEYAPRLRTYPADRYGEGWGWYFPEGVTVDLAILEIRDRVVFLVSRETTQGESPETHLVTRGFAAEDGSELWEDRVAVVPWATANLDIGNDRACILVVDGGGPDPYSYAVRCLRRRDGTSLGTKTRPRDRLSRIELDVGLRDRRDRDRQRRPAGAEGLCR
jgi:hypothetical protein